MRKCQMKQRSLHLLVEDREGEVCLGREFHSFGVMAEKNLSWIATCVAHLVGAPEAMTVTKGSSYSLIYACLKPYRALKVNTGTLNRAWN